MARRRWWNKRGQQTRWTWRARKPHRLTVQLRIKESWTKKSQHPSLREHQNQPARSVSALEVRMGFSTGGSPLVGLMKIHTRITVKGRVPGPFGTRSASRTPSPQHHHYRRVTLLVGGNVAGVGPSH